MGRAEGRGGRETTSTAPGYACAGTRYGPMTSENPYEGAQSPDGQDFPPPGSYPEPAAPQPPSQYPDSGAPQPPSQYPNPGAPQAPPQQTPYEPQQPLQYPSPGHSAQPSPAYNPRQPQQPYGAPQQFQPPAQGQPQAYPHGGEPNAYPAGGDPNLYGGQQAGYQQYPPAYAQPQKKSRKWLWVLLGIPLLALLGIGGCTAVLFRAVSGPIDATNAFVAELDEGDFDGAYQSLCQATRNAVPAEQWTAEIEAGLSGDITDYRFTEASVSSVNGSSTAVVSGSIEIGGLSRNVTYSLVEEGSEWRVCQANS